MAYMQSYSVSRFGVVFLTDPFSLSFSAEHCFHPQNKLYIPDYQWETFLDATTGMPPPLMPPLVRASPDIIDADDITEEIQLGPQVSLIAKRLSQTGL